jgi:tRNA (guanine37-N1)-methyltransferase
VRFDVVTLFPGMFDVLRSGVTGRAMDKRLVTMQLWNPRDYTADPHRTVDDRPYGGGPGMVMKVEPLRDAIDDAKGRALPGTPVVCLTPQGRRLDQASALEMSKRPGMILVAGRYEGIDERVIEARVDEEWSIGDYVLSGGELAAMVLMDTIIRLLPGVLGHEDSAIEDSYMDGLLDSPHYTRPEVVEKRPVPPVLLSGDHAAIKRWRLMQALGRTWERRPDLLESRGLTDEERRLLDEFKETNT